MAGAAPAALPSHGAPRPASPAVRGAAMWSVFPQPTAPSLSASTYCPSGLRALNRSELPNHRADQPAVTYFEHCRACYAVARSQPGSWAPRETGAASRALSRAAVRQRVQRTATPAHALGAPHAGQRRHLFLTPHPRWHAGRAAVRPGRRQQAPPASHGVGRHPGPAGGPDEAEAAGAGSPAGADEAAAAAARGQQQHGPRPASSTTAATTVAAGCRRTNRRPMCSTAACSRSRSARCWTCRRSCWATTTTRCACS